MEMIFFNLSRYFKRCCIQNLCKEAASGKIRQCQIYLALFQPFCEYTAWKVLIKYHFLHSWIQLLNSLKQASDNNKHTPIIFTSSSVQSKRLTIKMTNFSHNQTTEEAATLKVTQNIKNLAEESAEVRTMHVLGTGGILIFHSKPDHTRESFQKLHSEGNILHKLYCTVLVFASFILQLSFLQCSHHFWQSCTEKGLCFSGNYCFSNFQPQIWKLVSISGNIESV